MSRYRLTPEAASDVFEIWSYIAADSIEAAEKVESSILEACTFLAAFPMSGHLRPNVTRRPVRFWTVAPYPNYMVVYEPDTQPLLILRVVHGARDLPRLFR